MRFVLVDVGQLKVFVSQYPLIAFPSIYTRILRNFRYCYSHDSCCCCCFVPFTSFVFLSFKFHAYFIDNDTILKYQTNRLNDQYDTAGHQPNDRPCDSIPHIRPYPNQQMLPHTYIYVYNTCKYTLMATKLLCITYSLRLSTQQKQV